MTSLEKYIKDQGPMLSGQVAKMLVESQGISESAARKRIERLTSPIHKLRGLFSEKQSFLYHQDDYNNQLYFENLATAFEIAGKRYAAIIKAIDYHHGIILKNDLANYGISPVVNLKGHLKFSTLIEKLLKIGVITNYDDNHYELNSYLSSKTEINFRHYKAIEFSKNLLSGNFNAWCRNIGLVSYKKGDFNSLVSGFQFAYTAPSISLVAISSSKRIFFPISKKGARKILKSYGSTN